jgi:hypothetical protein
MPCNADIATRAHGKLPLGVSSNQAAAKAVSERLLLLFYFSFVRAAALLLLFLDCVGR